MVDFWCDWSVDIKWTVLGGCGKSSVPGFSCKGVVEVGREGWVMHSGISVVSFLPYAMLMFLFLLCCLEMWCFYVGVLIKYFRGPATL